MRPFLLHIVALALAVSPFLPSAKANANPNSSQQEESHAFAIFQDPQLPHNFSHFPYVNPNAPKGGELSLVSSEARLNANYHTFDSLNNFILKGAGANGLHLTFDTLMTPNHDEPDALYGLIARSVKLLPNQVVFKLRPQARFSDDSPLTAHDVAFTLNTFKQNGHPLLRLALTPMLNAVAQDNLTLLVNTKNAPKAFPGTLAQLPVLSQKFHLSVPFNQSSSVPFLGSGPYIVSNVNFGRSIAYKRRPDYWALNLPVNRGRWNFNSIKYEYFRDDSSQFEAFKSGQYLFHEEFISRRWASDYTFPAVKNGSVVKLSLPDGRISGAQGWFLNLRRPQFQDRRVREALQYAFDFPWTNSHLFHNLYLRTESFFDGSPLKAPNTPPSQQERALLHALGAPAPILNSPPWSPPKADGSGRDRTLLRHASKLLREAGWIVQGQKRRNPQGNPLSIEFLLDLPSMERVTAPLIQNLTSLGVDVSVRIVDPVQYQQRRQTFDFDVTVERFSIPNTPGQELIAYLSSRAAQQNGSRNLSGVNNPLIDQLIQKVIHSPSRKSLHVAAHALDRALRHELFWIPQWRNPNHFIAFHDVFARPKRKPTYSRGVLDTWWRDPNKTHNQPSRLSTPRLFP